MTMEAVAAEAGVGKPAIYRRYADKAALVAAVDRRTVAGPRRSPTWATRAPSSGRRSSAASRRTARPTSALIGGLMAEHRRHPELIDAFRRSVLLPRRAVGLALVERGQRAATSAPTSSR